MPAPRTVDEYLASLPDVQRRALQLLRDQIRAAAPEATESIAYGMPAFRSRGKFLVSYAAYRAHLSLYPYSDRMLAELGPALAPHLSGKGTLRFTPDRPIPPEVVQRIVAIRLEETGRIRPTG